MTTRTLQIILFSIFVLCIVRSEGQTNDIAVLADNSTEIAVAPTNTLILTTSSGRKYEKCEIVRVELDGLHVRHSKGIAKLYFTELPREIREKYNYDPSKAQQYAASVAKAQVIRSKSIQASQVQQQKVSQVMDQIKEEDFSGTISDIESDNALGWKTSLSWHGGNGMVLNNSGRSGRPRIDKARYPIMIYGLPKNIVDGSSWSGKIYTAGTEQFQDVDDRKITVKRYATTKDLAARLLLGGR